MSTYQLRSPGSRAENRHKYPLSSSPARLSHTNQQMARALKKINADSNSSASTSSTQRSYNSSNAISNSQRKIRLDRSQSNDKKLRLNSGSRTTSHRNEPRGGKFFSPSSSTSSSSNTYLKKPKNRLSSVGMNSKDSSDSISERDVTTNIESYHKETKENSLSHITGGGGIGARKIRQRQRGGPVSSERRATGMNGLGISANLPVGGNLNGKSGGSSRGSPRNGSLGRRNANNTVLNNNSKTLINGNSASRSSSSTGRRSETKRNSSRSPSGRPSTGNVTSHVSSGSNLRQIPHNTLANSKNAAAKAIGNNHLQKAASSSSSSGNNPVKSSSDKRHMVNLEEVIFREEKIWCILEALRECVDISQFCEEWRQLVATTTLVDIEKLFKDEKTRRGLRQGMILENVAVTLSHFLTHETDLYAKMRAQLQNLFFYIHQNFLILIFSILMRLPAAQTSKNMWAMTLKTIMENKTMRPMSKQLATQTLGQHIEIICQILKSICHTVPCASPRDRPTIYNTTLAILHSLPKLHTQRCHAILEKSFQHSLETQEKMATLLDESILPEVSEPYLPPVIPRTYEGYTLVLDLDETLVHYFESELDDGQTEGCVLIRPGAREFLREMSKYYEVVIFTAAMQDYADWVLDQVDNGNWISYRLYRQHATVDGSVYCKDLSKLGRDLSKVIIVDNVAENFQLQPDNGIFIRSWFDDMSDTALSELSPLLKEIVKRGVSDVRQALRDYRDQMIEQISNGVENPHLNLNLNIEGEEEVGYH